MLCADANNSDSTVESVSVSDHTLELKIAHVRHLLRSEEFTFNSTVFLHYFKKL